jgi:predicted amidohydrolase YtcJ
MKSINQVGLSLFIMGVLFAGIAGACTSSGRQTKTAGLTAITNVRIFDGEYVIEERLVVISGSNILAVGGEVPEGATIIDGHGATLLSGLIDSHVHTDMDGLKDALKFGVTTELEMNGHWTKNQRRKISEQNDIADVRSPENAATAPGAIRHSIWPIVII